VNELPALHLLLVTAVSIGAVHTVVGIDHSLPFVVLAKARGWSLRRTLVITALCGTGHVLSSVLLGIIGIGIGTALERLNLIEATRGSIAAWLLIGFGLFYAARALLRMQRRKPHKHSHSHGGADHEHVHDHSEPEHMHPHEQENRSSWTVWTLFIVFAFGPCEPLIPLLMAPAAMHHPGWAVLVATVFGAVTIAVMMGVVALGYLGLSQVRMRWAERYADVVAGLAIASSGLAIQAFGI
jgi:ABC-type nickel/cobalt efflux system permease component RcnA